MWGHFKGTFIIKAKNKINLITKLWTLLSYCTSLQALFSYILYRVTDGYYSVTWDSKLSFFLNWHFSVIFSICITSGITSLDWLVETLTSSLLWSSSFIWTNEKGNVKLLDVKEVITTKTWWQHGSSINNSIFKVWIIQIKVSFLWMKFKKTWYFHLSLLHHNPS